jgi:hypothetical protein
METLLTIGAVILLFIIIDRIIQFRTRKKIVEKEYKIDESSILENDVFKIIEPLWDSINIYDGEKEYKDDLNKFNREQQYVFAILWYNSEVCNGGHYQFYSNSTGIVWEEALLGFQAINFQQAGEILNESVRRLNGKPDKDRMKRENQLDEMNDDLGDLDKRYYNEVMNILDEKLLRYVKKNKEKFYFNGKLSVSQ